MSWKRNHDIRNDAAYLDPQVTDIRKKIGTKGTFYNYEQTFGAFDSSVPHYYVFQATNSILIKQMTVSSVSANNSVEIKLFRLNNGNSISDRTEISSFSANLGSGLNILDVNFHIPDDGAYYAIYTDNTDLRVFTSSSPLGSADGVMSSLQAVTSSGSNANAYVFLNWLVSDFVNYKIDSLARIGEEHAREIKNNAAQLAQKATKEELNLQIGKLKDATPLFANSVNEMTDTTKLYVNLSDGFLYLHDGGSWSNTGVKYQATGVSDRSVGLDQMQDPTLITEYVRGEGTLNLPLTQKGKYEVNLNSKGDIFLSNGNLFDLFKVADGTYTYEGLTVTITGGHIKIAGTLSRNMYLKLSDTVLFGTSTTEAKLTERSYTMPNLPNFRYGWYNLTKNADVPNMTMAIRSIVSGNIGSVGTASSNTNTGVVGSNWGALYLFLPLGNYQVEFDGILIAYDPYKPEYEIPPNTTIVKSVNKARVSLDSEFVFTSVEGTAYTLLNTYESLQKVKENPLNKQICVEGHTDYFYFYIKGSNKDSNKYLRYRFEKYVNAPTKADGWVLGLVDAVELVDGTWNYLFPVIMKGEWEMAVKIKDRPDFIGLKEHGSEVNYYTKFYIDGISWTPNEDSVWCDEIRIIQKSNMYDPNDEITLVGKHNKDYSINGNSIAIKQKIDWLSNLTMDRSYVTMLPIIRGNDVETSYLISEFAFDDYNLEEINVSSVGHGAKTNDHEPTKWNLYSTSTGISAEVQSLIKNKLDEAMSFVQNTEKYNKVYFTYCELDYQVNNGDIWEWESIYKLNISS